MNVFFLKHFVIFSININEQETSTKVLGEIIC